MFAKWSTIFAWLFLLCLPVCFLFVLENQHIYGDVRVGKRHGRNLRAKETFNFWPTGNDSDMHDLANSNESLTRELKSARRRTQARSSHANHRRRQPGSRQGDFIVEMAGVNHKMPMWLQSISTFVKPLILTYLFGPPKPNGSVGGEFSWTKPILFLILTFIPGLATLISDMEAVFNIFTSGLIWWDAIMATLAVLVNSSNLTTGLALHGLNQVFYGTSEWFSFHDVADDASQAEQKARLQVVRGGSHELLFRAYTQVIGEIQIKWGWLSLGITCFCVIISVPAGLAYIWITVPLGLIAWVANDKATQLIMHLAPRNGIPLFPWYDKELAKKVFCRSKFPEGLDKDGSILSAGESEYKRNQTCYNRTWAPEFAWEGWLRFSAVGVVLVPLCNIAVRFYCGEGYWPSLTTTWHDRSLREWATTCSRSLQHFLSDLVGYIL